MSPCDLFLVLGLLFYFFIGWFFVWFLLYEMSSLLVRIATTADSVKPA